MKTTVTITIISKYGNCPKFKKGNSDRLLAENSSTPVFYDQIGTLAN